MLESLPYDERNLLLQIVKGDEIAFRKIFDHYWDQIFSVCFKLTKSTTISEELVQDIFLKIWLKRDKLSDVLNFESYLFIVARNHIYNEMRKKTKEQPFLNHLESFFTEVSAVPDQVLAFKETSQIIDRAIKLLPGQQRKIFELSRNDGMEYSQIGQKMHLSKLTVKTHMKKALQFIRYYLQRETVLLLILYFSISATFQLLAH